MTADRRKGLRVAALGTVALVLSGAAHGVPLDEFAFRAGGFASRVDTTVHLYESSYYQGTIIDFDEELELDEESVVEFAGFTSRPWQRHQFELNYFDQRLSGTRQLRREVDYEGEAFVLHGALRSRLSMRAIEFSYTWWALLDDDWALGLRLGYMDYRLRASMRLSLGAQDEPAETVASTHMDERVPVPSLGVDLRVQLASRWRMKLRVGWLEKQLESVSPRVITMHAGLEYLPWKHFGAWVDYGINRLDVDSRRDEFNAGLQFDEGGLRVGGTWRF